MARMIDADALLEHIKDLPTWWEDGGGVYGQAMKYPEGMFDVDDVVASIENAPTLTQPNEWVSVEDALPPNMDDVLVVVQNNGECWTVTGYYSNTSNVWYAMLNGQDTQMDVLWWMPLPAPPNRRPPEGEEETR